MMLIRIKCVVVITGTRLNVTEQEIVDMERITSVALLIQALNKHIFDSSWP